MHCLIGFWVDLTYLFRMKACYRPCVMIVETPLFVDTRHIDSVIESLVTRTTL